MTRGDVATIFAIVVGVVLGLSVGAVQLRWGRTAIFWVTAAGVLALGTILAAVLHSYPALFGTLVLAYFAMTTFSAARRSG
jgi:hypothetical protein